MRGCTNQRYYIAAPDGTLLIPPGNVFPEDKVDGGGCPPQTEDDKVWRWKRQTYLEAKDRIVVKRVRSSNLVDDQGREVKWNVFTKTYLNDVIKDSSAKPNSLIEEHINQISSHELNALGISFDFAKPSTLIRYLAEIAQIGPSETILDFFAGSGTTAHAVIDMNMQDSGNRKFILVQLPEPTERTDYRTIADITKDRVRRVIKKTQTEISRRVTENAETKNKEDSENPLFSGSSSASSEPPHDTSSSSDLGFKVFKLAPSNFTTWDAQAAMSADSLSNQLDLHIDHIRDKRTATDILYEIILKSGYQLTTPVETLTIEGKAVFSVAEGGFLICLEEGLNLDLIKAIASREPARVVCLDVGFKGNDELKTNAVQTFKSKNIVFKTV